MEEQFKPLVMKRRNIKASLTCFRNFFDANANETDTHILQKRLDTNIPLLKKCDIIQSKIKKIVEGTDFEMTHATDRSG